MSDARDQILDAVRLRRSGRSSAAAREAPGRQGLLPPRFVREAPDLADLFLAKLTGVGTSHSAVSRLSEVPMHLAAWLLRQGLPARFVVAPEARLTGLDWGSARLYPELRAPDILAPSTIVSGAFAGVAETGSLAFLTSESSRPSHNLLAETHVVVLDRARVVASFEDVWRTAAQRGLPRSIAFVTGASRTADIEMTMELGVHGAVRMHVIVVG